MDEELFLPVLSHFENGNFWTASGGALRYKVVPDTGESPRLTAEVWEGPWRYQDSTVEETKEFPLSEEGLEELRGWLARWRTEMNARPKKTLEETLAARAARRAELEAAAVGKQEGGPAGPGEPITFSMSALSAARNTAMSWREAPTRSLASARSAT